MNKQENIFAKQKRELEEIRKESFKQGVWKGKAEELKRVEEVIDNSKCYLFEEIGEDGNRTGKQEPAILREELIKKLGLKQTQTQEVGK